MKIAGLKMKSSIKNQWCYFETIIIPDKEIKVEILKWIYLKIIKWP
jgi:hypothetical protein